MESDKLFPELPDTFEILYRPSLTAVKLSVNNIEPFSIKWEHTGTFSITTNDTQCVTDSYNRKVRTELGFSFFLNDLQLLQVGILEPRKKKILMDVITNLVLDNKCLNSLFVDEYDYIYSYKKIYGIKNTKPESKPKTKTKSKNLNELDI